MSNAGWILPGPISPLDCDRPDCSWRVHGVPDRYHASALARHVAEAHQAAPVVSERSYPIRPLLDDDPRFTFGLTSDIAEVLKQHGYPPITNGLDLVDLRQALYRFLYRGPDSEATS